MPGVSVKRNGHLHHRHQKNPVKNGKRKNLPCRAPPLFHLPSATCISSPEVGRFEESESYAGSAGPLSVYAAICGSESGGHTVQGVILTFRGQSTHHYNFFFRKRDGKKEKQLHSSATREKASGRSYEQSANCSKSSRQQSNSPAPGTTGNGAGSLKSQRENRYSVMPAASASAALASRRAARTDIFTRPLSSMPMHLAVTTSPTLTTSSVLAVRPSASSEM